MAQRKTQMDLEAFLLAVRARLDNGEDDFANAAEKAVAKHDLDPELANEALHKGLAEIARRYLGTEQRQDIMRSVRVKRTSHLHPKRVVQVSSTRCELRDWPVVTVNGYRTLEECSIEDAEAQVTHFTNTINGIARRRAVIEAVIREAKRSKVSLIGELPDDVLARCLTEGEV